MGNTSSCASGASGVDHMEPSVSVFTTAGMQLGTSSDATTAAAAGNIHHLTALLQAYPHALTHQSLFTHRTLAHAAAEAGQLQSLLAAISFITDGLPSIQHAVLYTSVESMGLHTRQQLVSYVLSACTVKGLTPLMLAAYNGHASVVKLLLHKGCDPWTTDRFGCRNALHYAALGGHASCVRALLDFVPRFLHRNSRRYVDARTLCGYTPLMCAAARGHLAAVNAMLSYEPHVNYASSYESIVDKSVSGCVSRSTPLHVACVHGHTEVALALLLHYAQRVGRMRDTRTLLDCNKRQPCDVAAVRGHKALAVLMQPDMQLTRLFNPLQLTPVTVPTLASLAAAAVRSHLIACIDMAEKASPGAAACRDTAGSGFDESAPCTAVAASMAVCGQSGRTPAIDMKGSRCARSRHACTNGSGSSVDSASGSGSSVDSASSSANSSTSSSGGWLAKEECKDMFRPLPLHLTVSPFADLQQTNTLPLLSSRSSGLTSPARISNSGSAGLSRNNSGVIPGVQLPRMLAPAHLIVPGSAQVSPVPTPRPRSISGVDHLPRLGSITNGHQSASDAAGSAALQPHAVAMQSTTKCTAHTAAVARCAAWCHTVAKPAAASREVQVQSASLVRAGPSQQYNDLQELCEPGLLPQEVQLQQRAAAAAAAAADAAEAAESLPITLTSRGCAPAADDDDDDDLCGVCFDRDVGVRVVGCGHRLCGGCAREMVGRMLEKPLACPFCRGGVNGFSGIV